MEGHRAGGTAPEIRRGLAGGGGAPQRSGPVPHVRDQPEDRAQVGAALPGGRAGGTRGRVARTAGSRGAHPGRDRTAPSSSAPGAPELGPKKLRAWLAEREPTTDWPAESTIGEALRRAGLTQPRSRHPAGPLRAPEGSNALRTIDYKGQFRTGDGQWVYPLTVMDAHSRYLLACARHRQVSDRGVAGAQFAGAPAQRQRQPVRLGRGRAPEQAERVVAEARHRPGADRAGQAAAERVPRAECTACRGRDGAPADGNKSGSTAFARNTIWSGRTRRWRGGLRVRRDGSMKFQGHPAPPQRGVGRGSGRLGRGRGRAVADPVLRLQGRDAGRRARQALLSARPADARRPSKPPWTVLKRNPSGRSSTTTAPRIHQCVADCSESAVPTQRRGAPRAGSGYPALQNRETDQFDLFPFNTMNPMRVLKTFLVLQATLATLAGPAMAALHGAHCGQKDITAASIRTREDIKAFVECAHDYVLANGTAEARRAFNEDERWKNGQFYVFVGNYAARGEDAFSYVYPPDPSLEGVVWGPLVDRYGTDYFAERARILDMLDPDRDQLHAGAWMYYSWINPETGRFAPKAAFVMEVMWNGNPAVIGAGIYQRDISATCYAEEVNAMTVESMKNRHQLMEFVRCAAKVIESKGFFGVGELMGERWRSGSVYVFGVDAKSGMQLFTGNPARVNGVPLMEGLDDADPMGRFAGRDVAAIGADFDEVFLYYKSFDPASGLSRTKVAFVKKVMAQGPAGAGRIGLLPRPSHGGRAVGPIRRPLETRSGQAWRRKALCRVPSVADCKSPRCGCREAFHYDDSDSRSVHGI